MTATQIKIQEWQSRQPAFSGKHVTTLMTTKAERQAGKRKAVRIASSH